LLRHHPFFEWAGIHAFAHRGGASDAAENTLAAFQHAVDLGYTYMETDVHATADGVLLAFHDDDLRRTCGVEGKISEMNWADVRNARVDGREPIPTFDELVTTWPSLRWNIDCKADNALPHLVAALRNHRILDRVCLGSFSDRRLRTLRAELGPEVATSLGPQGVARLRLAVSLGRSIRFPDAVYAVQIPPKQGPIPLHSQRFIDIAHESGLHVHYWTIDDPNQMHELLDRGADGIMTDKPTILRDVLVGRERW
jgi:glycerophosphoryl diester phosphodiesterase